MTTYIKPTAGNYDLLRQRLADPKTKIKDLEQWYPRERDVLRNMKQRVATGDRTISTKWKNLKGFLASVADPDDEITFKPAPKGGNHYSIDIEDVTTGHYGPLSCRWATTAQQNRNRHNSVRIVIDGREYSVPEVARMINRSESTVRTYVRQGRDISTYLVAETIPFELPDPNFLPVLDATEAPAMQALFDKYKTDRSEAIRDHARTGKGKRPDPALTLDKWLVSGMNNGLSQHAATLTSDPEQQKKIIQTMRRVLVANATGATAPTLKRPVFEMLATTSDETDAQRLQADYLSHYVLAELPPREPTPFEVAKWAGAHPDPEIKRTARAFIRFHFDDPARLYDHLPVHVRPE